LDLLESLLVCLLLPLHLWLIKTNNHLGSLAAGFQSFMYGGFTPAGGIFATLTSMAMLGMLMPPFAIMAAAIATGVAAVVWKLGVGK
jgi:hypothetical protein